jgi:MATE family multidrug resistance protein
MHALARRFASPAHRESWRLAWPLILSNISVPLLGMTDTAVVGHLPEPHHLGGVALGSATFSALYFAAVALRMGTTGLMAQAYGAGDRAELVLGLLRALLLALAIGAALLLLAGPITDLALAIYQPGPQVGAALADYLGIRLLAAPAALTAMVLVGWLLGHQDARGPLTVLIAANGVNILLDLLFVLGFGWGVAGVAWATVIADHVAAALGLWLVRRKLGGWPRGWSWAAVLNLPALRRLLAVNGDIVLRSLCLQVAFVGLATLGARQGEVVLAANTVLLNLLHLASFSLDGFAHAAEALVGRCVGARDRAGMRAAVRAAAEWSLAFALLIALGFALAGPALIRLLTDLAEVRALAIAFLPYMIVMPLLAVWAFLLDGVFIGATRTAEMRNGMILALACFAGLAALLVPRFGNHGLWLAFSLFMAARGAWLGWVYWRLERGAGFIGAAGPATRSAKAAP